MEKFIHTYREVFDSETMKERRVIYTGGGPTEGHHEAEHGAATEAPEKPASPDEVKAKYESEKYNLIKKAEDILAKYKDDKTEAGQKMAKAAHDALGKIETEKPVSNLSEQQIMEFRARINEILYRPQIDAYKQKRAGLFDKVTGTFAEATARPRQIIDSLLKKPAFGNLSDKGQKAMTEMGNAWMTEIMQKISSDFPYASLGTKLPDAASLSQEKIDDANKALDAESAKLSNPEEVQKINAEIGEIDKQFKFRVESAAYLDLATAQPNENSDQLTQKINAHIETGARSAMEKIALNLQTEATNTARAKNKKATEVDLNTIYAQDTYKGAQRKADTIVEMAHTRLNVIGTAPDKAAQRAVVLAWVRDQLTTLVSDPTNPEAESENAYSSYMATEQKVDQSVEGKAFLTSLSITPQEKKPEAEAAHAEAAPAKAEQQPQTPEQIAWAEARTAPTEYQIPLYEIILNADKPQGAKFNLRISRGEYQLAVFKNPEGYILNYPGGHFKFKTIQEVKDALINGSLVQHFTHLLLQDKKSYEKYSETIPAGDAFNFKTGPEGSMATSFDLSWAPIGPNHLDAHVDTVVQPHGAIEYRITRAHVGLNGEDSRTGRAGSFRDLMLQLADARDWAEKRKYKNADPNEKQREIQYKEITNPMNYYSKADKIGRPVFFGITPDNNAVRLYLDWGAGTNMDGQIKNGMANPFIQVSLKPDGTLDLHIMHTLLQLDEHSACNNMQEVIARIATCRLRAAGLREAPKPQDELTKKIMSSSMAYGQIEGASGGSSNAKPEKAAPTVRLPDGTVLVTGEAQEQKAAQEKKKEKTPKKAKETKEEPADFVERIKETKTILEFRNVLSDVYYDGQGMEKKPAFQKAAGEKLGKNPTFVEELKMPEGALSALNLKIGTMEDFVATLKKGQIADDTMHQFLLDNMIIRPKQAA